MLNAARQVVLNRRAHFPNRLWVDGDSYVGGAYGYSFAIGLRNAGYEVISTGVGSSTMAQIRDRVIGNALLIRQCAALVIWDGSFNGLVTVESYTDIVAEAVNAAGVRTIVVPAAVGFGNGAIKATAEELRDEFLSRWPTNTYDWRDDIPNTDGVINEDQMAHPELNDLYHLAQSPYDLAGAGVVAMLP